MAYRQFLENFENGLGNIDEHPILAKALAQEDPQTFLSTLEEHENSPFFTFNKESVRPPIIFGLYKVENELVFTPYFYDKNMEFSIESFKNTVQVIAYMAKSVGENFKADTS